MTKKALFFVKFILSLTIIFSGVTAFAVEDNTEMYSEPDTAVVLSRSSADVKRYSVKADGNTYLSKNFKVSEFKCSDGSDAVLIDSELVIILQNIRDYFGVPVIISSGYRTAEYNANVGGGSSSLHLYGRAADIKVTGVSPWNVAKYAENIGVKGVGLYNSFVHIDTRDTKYYWDSTSGSTVATSSFGGKFNSLPYNKQNADVVTGIKVNATGNTVNVSWNKSNNAQSYDVYLVTAPYSWSDIKYKKTVYSNSCSFSGVAKGSYYAFAVSRPNSDSMQSLWIPFKIN